MGDKVGDFYVHLVHGTGTGQIDDNLTSSTKLLSTTGKPTVIHFYDGGCGGCRPCAAQMRAWSEKIPQVQFLCVCVESRQVAAAFHSMFRFTNSNVVNGYIPSRGYMPVGYGQLGCSGFIVSDKDGCFISKKTRAYLQFGEAAFDYVESLLAPHIPAIVVDLTTSDEDAKHAETEVVVDEKQRIEMPASVGVTAMDDEHQECTDSFNQVIENPTAENLKHLSEVLTDHFAHEEKLMKHFSGNSSQNNSNKALSSSSFSALDSHIMDHKRILNILNEEVHRVNSCGLKGKCHEVPVDLSVVQKVAGTFHVHAERFDALYDGMIPSHAQ